MYQLYMCISIDTQAPGCQQIHFANPAPIVLVTFAFAHASMLRFTALAPKGKVVVAEFGRLSSTSKVQQSYRFSDDDDAS